MKPDDNYQRKCYADDSISKDQLLGTVPSFMKAENQVNSLYCATKELSSKFFNHPNIKGRLDLYPKSLVRKFEDKISELTKENEKNITKQCEDTKTKLFEFYLQFSKEVDTYVQSLFLAGQTGKQGIAEATLERNIKPLLVLAETKRNDYFKAMNNDYIEGLLRELSSAEPLGVVAPIEPTDIDLSSTNPSFEYKDFKFKSSKTTLDIKKPPSGTEQKEMKEGPPEDDGEVSHFNQQ